jgi:uncharacterized protein
MKTIWIDICHPPQAVFYIPIARRFRETGYALLITVQENRESFALLQKAGLAFVPVGKKYGRNKLLKAWGLCQRSFRLWSIVKSKRIWIGVSQGSPYQIVVCRMMGIPSVAIGDNEHTDWFFAKWVQKLILPAAIPEWDIHVPIPRVYRFQGLKEEIYLDGFRPDPRFTAKLGWKPSVLRVILRPPAMQAQYHHPLTAALFDALVKRLLSFPGLQIVFLPRIGEDVESLIRRFPGIRSRMVVPDTVVDGLNLIYHSDAVFSGGGTMSREAAILGVPAYSYFQGISLAVDRFLIERKKLVWIGSEKDITELQIRRQLKNRKAAAIHNRLTEILVNEILKVRERKSPS